MLCQPGKNRSETDLHSSVRNALGERAGRRLPYLGLHHRIDRGTSGVVLFTKSRHVNPAIARIFAEGRIGKRYLALCARPNEETGPEHDDDHEWTIENRLAPHRSRGRRRQASVAEGGRIARTHFRIQKTFEEALLVEASPLTGRFHQIRVHLAEHGMPILGDRLYGYPNRVRRWTERPMLHAEALIFEHPLEATRVDIHAPIPEDFRAVERALESAS